MATKLIDSCELHVYTYTLAVPSLLCCDLKSHDYYTTLDFKCLDRTFLSLATRANSILITFNDSLCLQEDFFTVSL